METAPETTASPAHPATTGRGIGNEFRSVVEATTMERRDRARARRGDRSLPPSHRTHGTHPTESETWRLAI